MCSSQISRTSFQHRQGDAVGGSLPVLPYIRRLRQQLDTVPSEDSSRAGTCFSIVVEIMWRSKRNGRGPIFSGGGGWGGKTILFVPEVMVVAE